MLARMPFLIAAFAMAAASSAACKDGSDSSAATGTTSAHSGVASAVASGRGLGAPDDDKRVLELVTPALGCKWGPKEGLSDECAAALDWRDASQPFEGGRADATLVNLLEDRDEKVRWLAATKLEAMGKQYRASKPLADRVVAAGEHETSARVAAALGRAIARIQIDATGTLERVRALAIHHALTPLRVGLIANLLRQNATSRGAYELTRERVHDPDPEVRVAAVDAFWMGGSARAEEACALWRDALDADDDDVVAHGAENLTHFGRCQSAYGALLDAEQHRLDAETYARPMLCSALRYLCEDVKAAPRDKERATAILHRVAERKTLEPLVRGGALEAVLACDPAGGKAYVKKFSGEDEQEQVRAIASDLLRVNAPRR